MECIRPMLIISALFASFPLYNFYTKNQKTPVCYKFYNVITLLVLLVLSIYQIYGRFTDLRFEKKPIIAQLVDGITNLFLIIFSLITTLMPLASSEKLTSFLYDLEYFDESVQQESSRRIYFLVYFSCSYAAILLKLATDIIEREYVGGSPTYSYLAITNILLYQFYIAIILILWFGIELTLRFRSLNDLFIKTVHMQRYEDTIVTRNNAPIFVDVKSEDILRIKSYHLKKIGIWHNNACNVLEKYNNLYGWNLFMFVLYEMASILNSTVRILTMSIFKEDHVVIMSDIVYFAYLSAVVGLLKLLLLAVEGDILEAEANRLEKICNKLLSEVIPVMPETEYDKVLREELQKITHQVDSREPHIATGFFTVNLKMMGFILTGITTNTIVVFQFIYKK